LRTFLNQGVRDPVRERLPDPLLFRVSARESLTTGPCGDLLFHRRILRASRHDFFLDFLPDAWDSQEVVGPYLTERITELLHAFGKRNARPERHRSVQRRHLFRDVA
jgi:hypothetical protein